MRAWVGVIILITGCSKPKPPVQPEGVADPVVAGKIRALLPVAASSSMIDLKAIGLKSSPPEMDDVLNQSLTMLFLTSHGSPGKSISNVANDPVKVAEAISRSKASGYATLLQPEFITDVTAYVQDDIARGTVTFKAEGVYYGKVDYTARFDHSAWEITEFRIPETNTVLKRAKDKLWKVQQN